MQLVPNRLLLCLLVSLAAAPSWAGRLMNARLCAIAVGAKDEGPAPERILKQHVDLLDVGYVGGRLREVDMRLEEAVRQHTQILKNYEVLAQNLKQAREEWQQNSGQYVTKPKWYQLGAQAEVVTKTADEAWIVPAKTAIVELEQHIQRIQISLDEHRELTAQWQTILSQGLVDNKAMIQNAEASLERTLDENAGSGNAKLLQSARIEIDQLKATREGQILLRHAGTNDLVQNFGIETILLDRLLPSLRAARIQFESLLL